MSSHWGAIFKKQQLKKHTTMETTVRLDSTQLFIFLMMSIIIASSLLVVASRIKEQTDYFKEQDKIDGLGE